MKCYTGRKMHVCFTLKHNVPSSRRGGLVVSKSVGLRSERSGVRSSLGSPCCILEQDTAAGLSLQRRNQLISAT